MTAAALPVAAHLGLLVTFDLAAHLPTTLFWLAVAMVGLVLGARQLGRQPVSGAAGLLAVAALLRLLLLPLPPSLSDDVHRYLWDGRVAGSGLNPYSLTPDAPELASLRDELWERLPHRDVTTVYPPLAIGLFSIASRLPHPVAALKGLLALLDLASCALLVLLARRLGLPVSRVAWYAWNPLVTLEVAGMGHIDALGVTAVLLTALLLLARPQRTLAAGLAAAAGVLAKLVPLIALPAWARRSRRPGRFLLAAVGLVILALAPIGLASGGVPPGLVRYGVSWEFNGPLYEPLWRLLERLEVQAAISSGLDLVKSRTGRIEFWNRLYPLNYPQLLARGLLAVGLLGALVLAWRERRLAPAMGRIFGAMVVFSATVYPWYLLWVLPWAALCRQPAWLALSGLVMLSYLPQFRPIALVPWVYLLIWGPFFLLLLWRSRWSTD